MNKRRGVIVGAETLLGRELRDVASTSAFGAGMRLIDAGPGDAAPPRKPRARESAEETVMAALNAEALTGAEIVFLAGTGPSSRKAVALAAVQTPIPAIVDLTHALEDDPRARLRAPLVESAGAATAGPLHVIAHPAAVALALFLKRLRKSSELTRLVVHIFEPASERGQPGIDELQQQTIGLLSFKPLSKAVYDAQLSFNLLPRFGEDAPQPLQSIEERIERHLATLLSHDPGSPMPSLRLIQAPVFHGYSLSVWAEFRDNPGVRRIVEALASAQVEIRAADEEAPTNVGAANQSGITVGAIEVDRNHPQACWFWIAADNLRIVADEAVAVAREIPELPE